VNEKIGRFDISVDDVFIVYFFETVTNLLENIDNFIFRELSSLAFNILFQVSFTVFKKKVQMFFGFSGLVKSEFMNEITSRY
jgi:hypothetical protein